MGGRVTAKINDSRFVSIEVADNNGEKVHVDTNNDNLKLFDYTVGAVYNIKLSTLSGESVVYKFNGKDFYRKEADATVIIANSNYDYLVYDFTNFGDETIVSKGESKEFNKEEGCLNFDVYNSNDYGSKLGKLFYYFKNGILKFDIEDTESADNTLKQYYNGQVTIILESPDTKETAACAEFGYGNEGSVSLNPEYSEKIGGSWKSVNKGMSQFVDLLAQEELYKLKY